MDGAPLAEGMRAFFGPLFFALVAIVGVFAAIKGQMTKLVQIVLLSIVVTVLLYQPNVLRGMGEVLAQLLPGTGASTGTGSGTGTGGGTGGGTGT